MALPPLKVAVLHYQPGGEPMDSVVGHISDALRELGHEAISIPVHDRVSNILTNLENSRCDIVFNVCETFADDYRMEVNVAALMEMARIRYTGSGTAGLLLAQDKIVTKQLLEYHEVPTPNFATFDGETFETHGMLRFPLIAKPARSDASLGIGQRSVVNDWDELTKRVREIRKEFNDEALAEEYIHGRELYVAVLGHATRPEILPVVELDFGNWEQKLRISDRDVKFGPETEGAPRLVIAKDIPPDARTKIERSALLAFRALKLRDYARIDFRLSTQSGEPYVLEANPNPYLERNSELAMAAKECGIEYAQLIGRILESACTRYGISKRTTEAPKAVDSSPPEPAVS